MGKQMFVLLGNSSRGREIFPSFIVCGHNLNFPQTDYWVWFTPIIDFKAGTMELYGYNLILQWPPSTTLPYCHSGDNVARIAHSDVSHATMDRREANRLCQWAAYYSYLGASKPNCQKEGECSDKKGGSTHWSFDS